MQGILRSIAAGVCAVLICGGTAAATMPPAPNAVEAARASEVDGNAGAAIVQLEPYVNAHPEDVTAARMLGDLYFRTGDVAHAQAVWLAETRRHPDDSVTHERLGSLYAARGRLNDAIGEFDKSLPLRGGLMQLIELQRRTNGLDAFVNLAQTSLRLNPDDPWHLTLYATVLEATHHPGEALQYYTRVVDLAPLASRCEERISRAVDLFDLRRDAEAITDLQQCLRSDPNDYAGLTLYAWTFLRSGDYKQARVLLDHALAAQPNGVEALIDMGYLEDATGSSDAAALCYRKAIAGDPLRPEGYINLGFDYATHRNYGQAEATLLAGLTAAPGNGRLHFLLGSTYRAQGKMTQAHTQYESALAADDADVVNAARDAIRAMSRSAG
jgi:tetratricopeptide (TPR) repeat protein